jgi:hypothetical protein
MMMTMARMMMIIMIMLTMMMPVTSMAMETAAAAAAADGRQVEAALTLKMLIEFTVCAQQQLRLRVDAPATGWSKVMLWLHQDAFLSVNAKWNGRTCVALMRVWV